ncbi:thioredoxin [Egicoccus sp. AB-alg2]|uniref:thioredoxin n=1 Tax=Egicoccus sp. AB-alg2 TaxID=3242693 RepID=UPI00359E1379
MATVELTADNFQQTIDDNEIVLVDFWAEWCGPCRMFGPIYEETSEDHPDLVFGKVDTEAQQLLAAQFNIQSIPTLMIIRDRVVLFSQPGALPGAALEDLVRQVRELDMDEIKREIAEQQSA